MYIYDTNNLEADFRRARWRAISNSIESAIRRQPNKLHSLAEIDGKLRMDAEYYIGLRQVPVQNIVGSVARYHDFDANFNPLHDKNKERWWHVATAYLQGITLPPVQLLKVGNDYLVKDGNHRISVARHYGVEYIDAEVTEFVTPCSLNHKVFCYSRPHYLTMLSRVSILVARTIFQFFRRHNIEQTTCVTSQ